MATPTIAGTPTAIASGANYAPSAGANRLFVVIARFRGVAAATLTNIVYNGITRTPIVTVSDASGGNRDGIGICVFKESELSSSAAAVTATWSGTPSSSSLMCITVKDASQILAGAFGSDGSSTGAVSVALATNVKDLCLGGWAERNAFFSSIDNGFTQIDEFTNGDGGIFGSASKTAAATTETFHITFTGAEDRVGAAIVIQPTTSGPASFVQAVENVANGNTITISPRPGNTLIVTSLTSAGGGNPTVTIADDGGSKWRPVVPFFASLAAIFNTAFICDHAAPGVTTITLTYNGGTPGSCALICVEVGGVDPKVPLIVVPQVRSMTAPGTGADKITSGLAALLNRLPAYLLNIVTNGGDSDTVAGTGFTSRYASTANYFVEDQRVFTLGAYAGTATAPTHGGTDSYTGYLFAFAEPGSQIGFVPTGTFDNGSTTAGITHTFAGWNVNQGENVSILVATGTSENAINVNDGANNYLQYGPTTTDATAGFRYTWWYNPNVNAVAGGVLTVSNDISGSNCAVMAVRGTGLDPAAPPEIVPAYAKTASTVSGTDNVSCAAVTPVDAPTVLVAIGIDLTNGALAAGTGFAGDGTFANLPGSAFAWSGQYQHTPLSDMSAHIATFTSLTTAHAIETFAAIFKLAAKPSPYLP